MLQIAKIPDFLQTLHFWFSRAPFRGKERKLRSMAYWENHLGDAMALLNHYAGFAERGGSILSGKKVSSWHDVEAHTPHGFLAHLAGLGFDEKGIKRAADLLFAFHTFLAETRECGWKPNIVEWERGIREVLALFEERFVLIEAHDEDTAWREAERLGKEQEVVYENPYGDEVRWKFVQVNEIFEVDGKHGNEIFSRFLTLKEAKSLLRSRKNCSAC